MPVCKGAIKHIILALPKVNQSMNEPMEALIELENKVRDLEARIKKLENWKLVHTSMTEDEGKNV